MASHGLHPLDADYVCQLDAETEQRAKQELGEDAKDRLNAVQTLRTWIEQQPHITFRTRTLTILSFLRTSKFSQLKARERIENYLRLVTQNTRLMRNIDTCDQRLLNVIDAGFVTALPKKDKNGCKIILYRIGTLSKTGQLFAVSDEIRAATAVGFHAHRDENVVVNGCVFFMDMTGIGAKHLSHAMDSDLRKWNQHAMNAMPGRFKAFHYYNAGAVFDSLLTFIKTLLSKKHQERVYVHDTLESLYKHIDMELLPTEYLPDDYNGPNAGSLTSITEKLKSDITSPEFRQFLLDETSESSYKLDETKRPNYRSVNESFRKLIVD